MSSNIEVNRICQHCSKEFLARTTVTKYCSIKCGQRAYKARVRTEKIKKSNTETSKIKSQPFEELKTKEYLSIKETCKLIGISRRTVYRLIEQGKLKIYKVNTRTIIKRIEINNLLEQSYTPPPKKEPQPVTEFYTVKEVEKKYFIKYGRLNTIINENKIPKTVYNGKLHVSKPHIDRYFKRVRPDISHITEWYTVQEIQKKYRLTRDQVYGRVSDNALPKKRIGRYVKISKQHFDELFEIGV
ncbi:MAG TPA: helix-turn-helix domain-containing protein [Saprospiraceae bacterium]|nr:helix-turn-helix domain-containing protein [Saprospiraceae bacterium]